MHMRTALTMLAVFCLLTLMATVASSAVVQVGSVDLIASRNGPDVGDVTVNWDDVSGELQVVIELTSTLGLDETHLYVGLTPPTKSAPGQFPYSHEGLGGATTDTYEFGEIGAYSHQTIYVAVHAALTDGRTAWADGELIGGKGNGKGNFAMYFTVELPALAPLPDITAPEVISTSPDNGDTGVGINTNITATFSEEMLLATIDDTTFTLYQGVTPIAGAVTYADGTATFNPDFDLAANETFTATITTGATDLAGNPLASDYVWSFATGAGADATAPTVTSTSPDNGDTDVSVSTNVTATFSEAMLPATIDETSFTLYQGLTPIAGAVSYLAGTATFNPTVSLAPNTTFTATITTGATDLAGNPLASDYVWTFTTGAALLGSAGNFAVLAGTTVTNTASFTVVNGDLGVWPGTAVTGFGPGIVNGTIHAGDAVAQQAQADLTVAYNDLAGRVAPAPITVAGNIGGQTLSPGLYKSTSSLAISSGDLTLDAGGDADAVFIFQIASTLTTTVGRQIILAGGANPANIYWQVGTSATLGTDSVFMGSILANVSITVTTGATVTGSLLARSGAVTLDDNTVSLP
jgi:hypothetical protein